jgi:hypothetical protein
MDNMMWAKPVEGRTVMEPLTKMRMPADGMMVSKHDPHWMAHLRFGDIEEVDPPQSALDDVKAADEAAEPAAGAPTAAAEASQAAEQPHETPPAPAATSDH